MRPWGRVIRVAKRNLLEHPKFAHFKMISGLPKSVALGYLECLWQFTGRYTPQGNIGKYTDAQIEAWVEWQGEPGELIRLLVEAVFLEPNDEYRLLVHDWADHVDNTTKIALKRAGLGLVVSTVSQQGCNGVSTVLRPPDPEPEPEPDPEPRQTRAGERARDDQMCPPTMKEVREYMKERNWVNPAKESEAFIAHYGKTGWKSGRSQVTDWKAAVISWESIDPSRVKPPPKEESELPESVKRIVAGRGW